MSLVANIIFKAIRNVPPRSDVLAIDVDREGLAA